MKKNFLWIVVFSIIIIAIGIWVGIRLFPLKDTNENQVNNSMEAEIVEENKIEISEIISAKEEEKTTPNTLMVYTTYYTTCKHYINEYQDIDISAVNLNEEDLKEKYREWKINSFSSEQVILEKEVEGFCDQHYKLKLVDGKIVIYQIDENNNELEYENTEITSEYLTRRRCFKVARRHYCIRKRKLNSRFRRL